MLKQLYIKNYAIADQISVEFGEKINILTGETGAGKSIIINALNSVLGERVSPAVIRAGEEKAIIVASFDISSNHIIKEFLRSLDLDFGDELILRRDISIKGSSRAYVNDMPVNLSTLSKIGDFLIDIHGQHEHQTLLKESRHLEYLDNLLPEKTTLQNVQDAYKSLVQAHNKLNRLKEENAKLLEEKDYLTFQLAELDKIDVSEEEYDQLQQQHLQLMNAEKIAASGSTVLSLAEENDTSLLSLLAFVSREVEKLEPYHADFKEFRENLAQAEISVAELVRFTRSFLGNLEFSPEEQEQVEVKLDLIKHQMKKYQRDFSGLVQLRSELRHKLDNLEQFDERLAAAEKEFEQNWNIFLRESEKLHQLRIKTAAHFSGEISGELHELGMPHAKFSVEVLAMEPQFSNAGPSGLDKARFLISPNPGQDLLPLAKIASGGEMSRVMLAIKKVFADHDNIPTLIFDEIDTGVSGEVAHRVGEKLSFLGRTHQLIVITHLPQIASLQSRHFSVSKQVSNNRTFTSIQPLSEEERVDEIARLIGGNQKDEMLSSARLLIEKYITE